MRIMVIVNDDDDDDNGWFVGIEYTERNEIISGTRIAHFIVYITSCIDRDEWYTRQVYAHRFLYL